MLNKLRQKYVDGIDRGITKLRKQQKCVGRESDSGCAAELKPVLDPTRKAYREKKQFETALKSEELLKDVSPYKRILNSQGSEWGKGAGGKDEKAILDAAKSRYLGEMSRHLQQQKIPMNYDSLSEQQRDIVCKKTVSDFDNQYREKIVPAMVAEQKAAAKRLEQANPLLSNMKSENPENEDLDKLFKDLIQANEKIRNDLNGKWLDPTNIFGAGCDASLELTQNTGLHEGVLEGLKGDARVEACYSIKSLQSSVGASCGLGASVVRGVPAVTACSLASGGAGTLVCLGSGLWGGQIAMDSALQAQTLQNSATLEERANGSKLKGFQSMQELAIRKYLSIASAIVSVGAPVAAKYIAGKGVPPGKAVPGDGVIDASDGYATVPIGVKAFTGNAESATAQVAGSYAHLLLEWGKSKGTVAPAVKADAETLVKKCAEFTRTARTGQPGSQATVAAP